MRRLLALVLLLVNAAILSAKEPFIIGAYFESWSQFDGPAGGRKPFTPLSIDASLFTDLYYAFSLFGYITADIDPEKPRLTGDYRLTPLYPNEKGELYPAFTSLKKRVKGPLRLFLSIGGAGFNDPKDLNGIGRFTYRLFGEMASTSKGREEFIASAVETAESFGFDGIDIDWEFPGDSSRGGREGDFENALALLRGAKEAFSKATPPLLLSVAVAPLPPSNLPKSYRDDPKLYYKWIAKVSSVADRVVLMAYNYHTPYDGNKITGVNAPLMRDSDPSGALYIAKSLEECSHSGVAMEKVLLGIPAYGWSYGEVSGLKSGDTAPGKPFQRPGQRGPYLNREGFLSYYEIADMIAKRQLIFKTDLTTTTAYAYNVTTRQWVSFDTPETTKEKVVLAKKWNLGGVIFWAVNLDEYQWEPTFPNIRAAVEAAAQKSEEL